MNKIHASFKLTVLAVGLVLVMCAMPLAAALADKADLEDVGKLNRDPTVSIMLGKADMIDLGNNVADVLVANPSIADVMAVKSNRLYVVGSALGDTNIIAIDENGDIVKRINVHVQLDIDKIKEIVADLYPNEEVNIHAVQDQLIITGEVSTPAVANSVANLIAQTAAETSGMDASSVDEVVTNMLSVRGEQQVMLRVKIVEASRSALKDLGVEASAPNSSIGSVGASLATAPALGLTAPAQLGVLALNYASGSFGQLGLLGRALEEEGIVNTLAEPNLTAISGEQAGFLAGGEFPIPTEIDRNGNLIYEFRPFGVSLNFRPIVMSSNRISLEMTTEISTTSFSQNLQLNGINVPTFNVRRAQTTVELPSGGTLMIAGLIQSETISGLTQLPGIGDVPVVGDLIKSDTFNRDETEVVVMITPYLVQPFAQNQAAEMAPASVMEASAQVQSPALAAQPAPQTPARDRNELKNVFGNNIRRTYGETAPQDLMKQTGKFGYITE